MARPEKVAVVDEIRTKLVDADAAILTEYRGLTVSELADLRGALRPSATEYKVFKNTLARRAAEDAGLSDLSSFLEGPTAIAFVTGDAVGAAKAIRDFGRVAPALVVKGGLLGNRILSAGDVEALAEIQPREVLLARLAGGFQAPLVKAAGLFQAFTRNFAYGLKAYVDQRVEGGEVADAPADAVTDAPADAVADAPADAVVDDAGADAPADNTPADETPAQTETETPAADAAEASTESEES